MHSEGGEEWNGKAGEEDCLDFGHRARGPSSLWESGNVVSEGGVVDLVHEDTEEGIDLGGVDWPDPRAGTTCRCGYGSSVMNTDLYLRK